jgi:hypothetical protein
VGDEKREPFEPGEGPPEADDRLRERVAAARESIGATLRDAVDRLEHSERAAIGAAEDRLARIATERVDDALVRLGMEKGQIQAEVDRRLERAIERLSTEVGARFGGIQARLEELAARSTERGADARAERDAIERAAADALGAIQESQSRALRFVSEATDSLVDSERRSEATIARIEQAMSRVEAAVGQVAEAERRVREIEQRAARTEGRVLQAAETAARAADWEARMTEATRVEAEAARRIREAERRLMGLVERPSDEPGGGAPR